MDENVTRIPLCRKDGTVRAYALIDAADAELVLANGPWHLAGGYAKHNDMIGKRPNRRTIITPMQRLIVGLEHGNPLIADHINRDRLDNRRSNLRVVTGAINAQNASARHGTSQYRGVLWHPNIQKWLAYAHVDKKRFVLGWYTAELEAAAAARNFRLANMPGAID